MILFLFIAGLCIGSFLNVLIDRLPTGESVVRGRSHCDHCKKPLRWFELIPLLSFFIQGGKCRRCHKKLSYEYPLIELITGAGFAFIWMLYSATIPFLILALVVYSTLLVILVSDLKELYIPDQMVLILGIVAITGMAILRPVTPLLVNHILSGIIPCLLFFALWLITKGQGLGFGDVKLVLVMGFLLGFPRILVALYVSFIGGAIVGSLLMAIKKKKFKSKIAFGPFLILGFFVSWFWTYEILTALKLW